MTDGSEQFYECDRDYCQHHIGGFHSVGYGVLVAPPVGLLLHRDTGANDHVSIHQRIMGQVIFVA